MKVSIVKYIVDKLKRSLAIVQDTDTATRNIAKDKFVNWKGNIYTANQAIASGSTLSAASGGNLTACDDGALNEIGNDITAINSNLSKPISNGVSSLTDVTNALNALVAQMTNGEVRSVRISLNQFFTPFGGGVWLGTICRNENSRYSAIFQSGSGDMPIYARYDGSSWAYEELALNSNSIKYKRVTVDKSLFGTIPQSGKVIGTVNDIFGVTPTITIGLFIDTAETSTDTVLVASKYINNVIVASVNGSVSVVSSPYMVIAYI